MRKGISESKVKRMRNLLTKKYGDKTRIRSGYTKKLEERKEGDTWFENGKKWTIKNGIRRNVSKFNKARKINKIPLKCPKCSKPLNHPAHKAMYRRWGMCLTCVSKWEEKMKKDGTYDDWYKEFDEKNFNAFINDVTVEYNEWVESRNNKHFITEAGDIEEWKGGKTNDELKEKFKSDVSELIEKRNGKTN